MIRMSGAGESHQRLRSAVLVDVDNVFHWLQSRSPAAAHVFVSAPQRWLQWLSTLTYPQIAGAVRRDFLARACYLNLALGGA